MEPKQDHNKSSQDGKTGIACSAAQGLHLSVFQCYSNPALLQECCSSVGNALMSQRLSSHVCIPSSSPACNNRFCRMAFLSKSISSGSELSSEECQPMSQASCFFCPKQAANCESRVSNLLIVCVPRRQPSARCTSGFRIFSGNHCDGRMYKPKYKNGMTMGTDAHLLWSDHALPSMNLGQPALQSN